MVKCTFQAVAFYEIAVSNDGEIMSEYIQYIDFNSHCHRCNSAWCTKRVCMRMHFFKFLSQKETLFFQ